MVAKESTVAYTKFFLIWEVNKPLIWGLARVATAFDDISENQQTIKQTELMLDYIINTDFVSHSRQCTLIQMYALCNNERKREFTRTKRQLTRSLADVFFNRL